MTEINDENREALTKALVKEAQGVYDKLDRASAGDNMTACAVAAAVFANITQSEMHGSFDLGVEGTAQFDGLVATLTDIQDTVIQARERVEADA